MRFLFLAKPIILQSDSQQLYGSFLQSGRELRFKKTPLQQKHGPWLTVHRLERKGQFLRSVLLYAYQALGMKQLLSGPPKIPFKSSWWHDLIFTVGQLNRSNEKCTSGFPIFCKAFSRKLRERPSGLHPFWPSRPLGKYLKPILCYSASKDYLHKFALKS